MFADANTFFIRSLHIIHSNTQHTRTDKVNKHVSANNINLRRPKSHSTGL